MFGNWVVLNERIDLKQSVIRRIPRTEYMLNRLGHAFHRISKFPGMDYWHQILKNFADHRQGGSKQTYIQEIPRRLQDLLGVYPQDIYSLRTG